MGNGGLFQFAGTLAATGVARTRDWLFQRPECVLDLSDLSNCLDVANTHIETIKAPHFAQPLTFRLCDRAFSLFLAWCLGEFCRSHSFNAGVYFFSVPGPATAHTTDTLHHRRIDHCDPDVHVSHEHSRHPHHVH